MVILGWTENGGKQLACVCLSGRGDTRYRSCKQLSHACVLPVCPVAGGGRCAASRCDGAWTPPRTPGLCRPVAG